MAARLSPVARAVTRALAPRREVQAAYVFGSAVTGRLRPDSDIDVAVLVDRRVQADRMSRYRLKCTADLGAALHRSDVDVVMLNEAPPLLAHRILSQGTLVFERSASARVAFQVKTAARYFDLIPMFELHLRYLKKSAQEGGIVG